jgi:hypothetical protein
MGQKWPREHFDIKWPARKDQPREDTPRGVSLAEALRNLGLWVLAGTAMSVWALKRRADKA